MITVERRGQRVYFCGNTFAAKDRIKAMGGHWDGESRQWWVGAAKAAEAEALAAELTEPAAPSSAEGLTAPVEDLDRARVYAQVEYKGRRYYVVAETRDQARCRLTTLDGTAPFWADCPACTLVRRYEGRPERGSYGRPTGRTVYPTVGSLRRFRDGQRDAKRQGVPACASCGKRSAGLCHDLEDGLMKCRACCDMPAD